MSVIKSISANFGRVGIIRSGLQTHEEAICFVHNGTKPGYAVIISTESSPELNEWIKSKM